ncbi:hypothetical protein A1O3_01542 [Capronia epimyces CBS 606.96]|uniref:Guanyl-nucleotide exchange factor n=1 Tax=Capronia epimyces CBS 606.96 TaxID=1182542 RepID=W9YUQ8_9EURO|nr:uncharacterized protein A1O3_01542 [Capronia epimyces CBS 606.96]EXJ92986.1 hypothetical protein A1O3_01542 [Capronia epimyces CBS 606.96]
MPLRTLLSKAGPRAAHRRHSSIIEDATEDSESSTPPGRSRGDSMKRLSLGLSRTNEEDTFHAFFTHEPAEIQPRLNSLQADEASQPSEPPSTANPAIAVSRVQSEYSQPPGLSSGLDGDGTLLKPQRFSLLGMRHASDSQLSTRFRKQEPVPPQDAAPPRIITTAPTHDFEDTTQRKSKRKLFGRSPSPFRKSHIPKCPEEAMVIARPSEEHSTSSNLGLAQEKSSFERLPRPAGLNGSMAPPAYGDESSSSLAIPVTRLSDSSRSDDSSGDHHLYAKTTTTHTISTTTTFFRLKRRNKTKRPLFPLPEKFATSALGRTSTSGTPPESGDGRKSMSPSRKSTTAVRFDAAPSRQDSAEPSPTHSMIALTNAPFGSPGPTIMRQDSTWSTHSGHSTPSVTLVPPQTSGRGRSSTMSSLRKSAEKLPDAVPQTGSARTSTSTSGRRSFGDLLSLPHRLRQNSAPPPRHGAGLNPGTPGSKSNSLHIPREPEPERVYPRREDGDTPASYVEKLEAAVPRGAMATILCKSADDFSKTCLRKYMRGFSYFGDSIDMAIRKMLTEVELPKETQQIDRLLAGFADRYHECNPGIFASTDETAFVAFSILLLHSDTHNKNNKRKMQKQDYVKNTQQGPVHISSDILECFYDNVCYTPFIHFEDEIAINSHRLAAPRPKKSLIRPRSLESLRGPVDPYILILDNKLDVLRPSLKDVMDTEDCYSSTGTIGTLETNEIQKAFLNSAVLQIVSARSRPDAFSTQATISNPGEAQAGLVSIKVAKVGLLWRKDPKKKKAKRPWQEWGAILTDSKLYFFKDVGWVKKLISQYEASSKSTNKASPLIFKPPLSSFDPDALMSMDDTVALLDTSYKKHKNAFVFIKHGGFEEVFLANNESEMNDWIGKLNYAAAFRTAGVRMRGLLSSSYEARHVLRKDSDFSTKSEQSSQKDRKVDPQVAWEIMFYRQQLINERISDFDDKMAAAQKELDNLLRNARHLLILLPIQQKTREALVLAAGRMSAKLKWTRVEFWRAKTHRDILAKDLEQEGVTAFPVPRTPSTSTPQKITPLKTSPANLARHMTDTSHTTLSPISAISSKPSNVTERHKISESESNRPEQSPSDIPSTTSPSISEHVLSKQESNPDSHSLIHQASVTSSHLSRDRERLATTTAVGEEQIPPEAGLIGSDGYVSMEKRPDTSESDRDRVAAITTPIDNSKVGSVRRSLHRSLREGHLRDGHHHSPSIHRHRKGRESGSSFTGTDDGGKSIQSEVEELRRGTGSFILHGKKASVITMSSEWQNISNEDRLRLRNTKTDGDEKEEHLELQDDDEDAVETVSNFSKQTEDHHYASLNSSRKPSLATTAGEQFVDAETGEG